METVAKKDNSTAWSSVQKSPLDFDMLDSKDQTNIQFKRVNESTGKEMDMANKLVEQLTEKFSIEQYKDTYTDKLLKIIKEKSKGKKISVPEMKVVHSQNDNLMDMLKASLSIKKRKSA